MQPVVPALEFADSLPQRILTVDLEALGVAGSVKSAGSAVWVVDYQSWMDLLAQVVSAA